MIRRSKPTQGIAISAPPTPSAVARGSDERDRLEAFAFLADASEMLAGTLDYETLAETLARIAVPRLADWCAVDILADDGEFHRIGAHHVRPDGADLLRELDRRFPIRSGEGHLRGRVVATGEPIARFTIDRDELEALARDPAHAAMLAELGMESAMWLPLEARGRMLGVLSFGVAAPERAYDDALLALGRELARRAALALDNARTYRLLRDREQQQAVVAGIGQRALAGVPVGELMDAVVESLARTLDVEFAKIVELEPDGAALRLVAGVGWEPGRVGDELVASDARSQAGFTLRAGEPVVFEDLATEHRFTGSRLLADHRVVAGMSALIEVEGRHWGVLGAYSDRRRQFGPDDVHFLQALANVLAGAIERSRAEEALRERDDRLELTLAASKTGTWDWDVRTGRLNWSDAILALHGLGPDDAPPDFDAYVDRIHPDDRGRFVEAVRRAVEEGAQLDLEFRIVWPNGEIRWTNGVGRVFHDEEGVPVRMFGIGRDVTDRRLAEDERDALLAAERESSALRDAFIGVLSHELRTPITTIYGGVKMLTRETSSLDEAGRRTILDDVEAEADHLRRLVEDLLVLTRAERGQIELPEEPIQLLHIMRRAAASEAGRWSDRRFEVPSVRWLPLVVGDDTSIEQVLRNLLGNAAKYSQPGTTIRIALETDDREVRVLVIDEGVGIAADEADHLFQLFYRSVATARTVSGAGIGLYVSRRLVEAMGGRIWAEPRSDGVRGSVFGFALRRYEIEADVPEA